MTEITELKKYEKQLTDVNSKLSELDDNRTKIIRLGIRLEGIVQYLRQKEEEERQAKRKAEVIPQGSKSPEKASTAAAGQSKNGSGDVKKVEAASGKLE